MAAGAIAQYMNSEQARRSGSAERRRMRELFSKLQTPDFDMEELKPEEYSMVEEYLPELAPYVAEAAPQLIETTDAMRTGRTAQLDALGQLRSTASQERDPAFMAAIEQASRQGQADAQSRQQSILQDQARRGVGSGAMGAGSLAAQLQGAASGMERSAEEGRAAAMESYRNRQAAIRDSATLGGQINQQEFNQGSRNADIINSFNQRLSTNLNAYNQNRADEVNRGNLRNIDARQRSADKNVDARNRFRGQKLDWQQQDYENKRGNLRDQLGMSKDESSARRDDTRDQNQFIQTAADTGAYYYDRSENPPKQRDSGMSLTGSGDEQMTETEKRRKKFGY